MTIADTYNLRTYNIVKMADVANAIDALRGVVSRSTVTTSINTTSTSFVDTGTSVTVTVAAGQTVKATFWMHCSASTVDYPVVQLTQDGASASDIFYLQDVDTSSNGAILFLGGFFTWTPSAGSHTYKIQWKKNSAGTVYSDRRGLLIELVQTT
jgi:hypothetical protein